MALAGRMSAQAHCEFLVRRARELVTDDPWAAKAWLVTARSLYPSDFLIQHEMYTIERNASRAASAGRLLHDTFLHFPDQPVVRREIAAITSALRSDSPDKQTLFLRGLFESLPSRVQCEMLLKATEQCCGTLERADMLLLLLARFPDTVAQHGVSLGETLLEGESIQDQESPVNCFRKLFVCDVLPLIINNPDVRLPANSLYKYLNKAAEFYINYTTRPPQIESPPPGAQDVAELLTPGKRSQRYIIQGLTEKSSHVVDPWDRLFKILSVVGMRCDWQVDKSSRSSGEVLHRMKDLCRRISNFESDAHAKYKNQIVYSTLLVFFKNAFQYVSAIQPSLFHGTNPTNQVPLILLEDSANAFSDIELERNKHVHKKRKLPEGREKPMSSDDEEGSGKSRSRRVLINKTEFPNSAELLDSFKFAKESWELLHSVEPLEKEFSRICSSWKTETWAWLRIFLTDLILYQGQYKKAVASLRHLTALQGSPAPQIVGQTSLEQHRSLIQLATCHFALGEYRSTCEKILELMCYMSPPIQDGLKPYAEPPKVKSKSRKGSDLKLWPCTNKAIMPYCLQLMLSCFKLRAFTDSRDDMALGHVIVLLQNDWPRGENLFLKAIGKICQQGHFQYENFFNYVTNIDMLEEFAYLRTQEGGKIQLELLPNQGILIKHHTVTRGITKGVKEDFRLAIERQVSSSRENLMMVLHRFCINEKILLLQTLTSH